MPEHRVAPAFTEMELAPELLEGFNQFLEEVLVNENKLDPKAVEVLADKSKGDVALTYGVNGAETEPMFVLIVRHHNHGVSCHQGWYQSEIEEYLESNDQ